MSFSKLLITISFAVCFTSSVFSQTAVSKSNFHQWAATPPMGWNSWDCFGPTVVEDEVKANADYMAKNLKSSGLEYVVVDIRWYVGNDKAQGIMKKTLISLLMNKAGLFLL